MNPNSNRRHVQRRADFTLIELLVVIAIISVLASMLLPALGKARKMAQRTTCMNNFNQIGKSLYLYMDDYDGDFYPRAATNGDNNSAEQIYNHTLGGKQNLGALVPDYASMDILYCPTTRWPGTQWYSKGPEISKRNFGVSGYSICSYTSLKVLIRYRERRGNRDKVSGWDAGTPIGMDVMQASLAGQSDANNAISHDREGFNVGFLDGSAGWRPSTSFPVSALSGRNNETSGGGNYAVSVFWGSLCTWKLEPFSPYL